MVIDDIAEAETVEVAVVWTLAEWVLVPVDVTVEEEDAVNVVDGVLLAEDVMVDVAVDDNELDSELVCDMDCELVMVEVAELVGVDDGVIDAELLTEVVTDDDMVVV